MDDVLRGWPEIVRVVGAVVDLSENPVHVSLSYRPTYLRGDCPFCCSAGLVVLVWERRWICSSCAWGGDVEKFTRMIRDKVQTRPLECDEFTLENAGIP